MRQPFLDLRSDGSFTCNPLIRTAALVQLAREPEGVAAETRHRAADWYVARGDRRTALAPAVDVEGVVSHAAEDAGRPVR